VYQLKMNLADQSLNAFDLATERPATLPLRLPVCLSGRQWPTDVYVKGGTTASIFDTRQLQVWDMATGRPRHPPTESNFGMSGVALTLDGHAITASSESVHRWDSAGHEEQVWPCRTQHFASHSTLSPHGHRFVNGGGFVGDQRPFTNQIDVHVWDTVTGKRTAYFKSAGVGGVRPFAFSPDSRWLAEPAWQNLRVWDLANNRQLWEVPLRTSSYTAAVFTPSGRTLISGDAPGEIREWDTVTGKEIRKFEGHPDFVTPSPWPKPYPPGHVGVVDCLAVSPDSRRLVSAADDRTIRVWETTTGKECALMERATGARNEYPRPHYQLAISPDGALLATRGQDGDRRHLIDLWDIRAGKRVATLDGHRDAVTALAFSPDGRRLISGDADTLSYIWEVPPLPHAPAATLDSARAASLWADLADADAAKAFRAVGAWTAAPDDAVTAFRRLRQPEKPVDAARINRLIADLDSDQFAVRERASKDLGALGSTAGRQLRQALEKKPSVETTRRIKAILAACPDEDLRGLRAIEVLEAVDTPASRTVLEEWAKGDPAHATAAVAAEALVRLRRR
jgi:hypothetical protein